MFPKKDPEVLILFSLLELVLILLLKSGLNNYIKLLSYLNIFLICFSTLSSFLLFNLSIDLFLCFSFLSNRYINKSNCLFRHFRCWDFRFYLLFFLFLSLKNSHYTMSSRKLLLSNLFFASNSLNFILSNTSSKLHVLWLLKG